MSFLKILSALIFSFSLSSCQLKSVNSDSLERKLAEIAIFKESDDVEIGRLESYLMNELNPKDLSIDKKYHLTIGLGFQKEDVNILPDSRIGAYRKISRLSIKLSENGKQIHQANLKVSVSDDFNNSAYSRYFSEKNSEIVSLKNLAKLAKDELIIFFLKNEK